jgi:hypothetical protein
MEEGNSEIMVVRRKSDPTEIVTVALILKKSKTHRIIMYNNNARKTFTDTNISRLRDAEKNYSEEIKKICREFEDAIYSKSRMGECQETDDEKYTLLIQNNGFYYGFYYEDHFEFLFFN